MVHPVEVEVVRVLVGTAVDAVDAVDAVAGTDIANDPVSPLVGFADVLRDPGSSWKYAVEAFPSRKDIVSLKIPKRWR